MLRIKHGIDGVLSNEIHCTRSRAPESMPFRRLLVEPRMDTNEHECFHNSCSFVVPSLNPIYRVAA